MSENIPESVPTSQDPRSKRPLKRRALSPNSKQATEVEALFANPEREIDFPSIGALSKKSTLPPPPEIVANVQGSSAGAGSGEFHVYKASRRREYERLKLMDEENAKEQADIDFKRRQEENKAKDVTKTEKNRKKREKQRQRKEGKTKPEFSDEQRRAPVVTETKDKANVGVVSPSVPQHDRRADSQEVAEATVEPGGIVIHDED